MKKLFFILLITFSLNSQNIDVNDEFSNSIIRTSLLLGESEVYNSMNIKPLNYKIFENILDYKHKVVLKNKKENIEIKVLGLDYFIEFNSKKPYNRNNGTMIPNRGYQHIISPGLFIKLGPLSVQLKPEHHYAENKNFEGFSDNHYPVIWRERYKLWNHIDMPERFGSDQHNKTSLGQSSIRFNWKNLSLGISNENIWWGPSLRNSIMMSNHAKGFKHITFNTISPVKSFIGNFEWQFITGRLENSGFTPPRTDYEFAGTKLYVPKINQNGATDDWRFLQGFIFSYSPKWIDGLSLGFIRWVQMYSDLIKGNYWWMERNNNLFPVFQNLFRSKDRYEDYEAQTDQAAGIFLKWFWKESKSEFYFEFYHNDSKNNIRDLILDSDHSRAATLGLQKVFKINNQNFLFNWEWTQMEQSASRLIRNAGSWYEHSWVYDGYTNNGEVLGSSIGPGSNSHYISLNRIRGNEKIGIGFEIVDQDNDFYHQAFASANDYRRYWKDLNFHVNFNKGFKKFYLKSNIIYVRSLNYQWELNDLIEPYYHPGKDEDNLHINLKLTYILN